MNDLCTSCEDLPATFMQVDDTDVRLCDDCALSLINAFKDLGK